VPRAGDNVRIPASTTWGIAAGLNQSAVALGSFVVEDGYRGAIASASGYLQIKPADSNTAAAAVPLSTWGHRQSPALYWEPRR
jgi:hypothetical protein